LPTIDYAHDFNFSRGNTIKNDIPVYGQATQRLIDVCIHPTAFGKLGEHSEFAIKFTEELFSGLNVFSRKYSEIRSRSLIADGARTKFMTQRLHGLSESAPTSGS
jgi:hypothetical protein